MQQATNKHNCTNGGSLRHAACYFFVLHVEFIHLATKCNENCSPQLQSENEFSCQ